MTSAYFIRHAKAKNRQRWTEPDHLRPLSKTGRRQAGALPEHFADAELSRLVSSPSVRCVQTLEPLAESRDLPVETADDLAEGASGGGALELMLSVCADGPAAFCTHADVMFDAIEELVAARVRLGDRFEFAVAGTWVLEIGERMFVAGEYLPPPAHVRPDEAPRQ